MNALALVNGTLYIGGDFTSIGNVARNHLAAVDAATGGILPWNPNADGRVTALATSGNTVYVGGDFKSIGGTTRYSLAAIDGTSGMLTQ